MLRLLLAFLTPERIRRYPVILASVIVLTGVG
jgi:hypothetical protein